MGEVVYILTNPSMPGLVKIGLTQRDDPIARMSELFTTGVPEPFQCAAAWHVNNAAAAESSLHSLFKEYKVSPNREFFRLDVSLVIAELARIGILDLTQEVAAKLAAAGEVAFRRPVQNWLEMDYQVGTRMQAGNTGEFVTVVDGRRVEYLGEVMSLGKARRLIKEKYPDLPSNGGFHVDGESVMDRYDATYPRSRG